MKHSEDLKLVIQAFNNSMRKRVESASTAVANLLNTQFFGISGPVKRLAAILGATGEHAGESLLEAILPEGHTKPIFSLNDALAAAGPLLKKRPYNAELHLAIGLLRVFDATQTSSEPGGEPRCDFHSETQDYLVGVSVLDPYGPLFFEMIRVVLAKLSPLHLETWDSAEEPGHADEAAKDFMWR